jgi:hypothetical protein
MDDIAKLITDDNFLADCCRVSEGSLSEAAIKHRWRKVVSETDWATMGSNDELVEAIAREGIRRTRSGQTAREKAQLHAIKAPDILNRIMTADDSISPRHKIEASREIRAIAATNQNTIPTSERYQITIVLSADEKLVIDKPIACGRLDDNGKIIDDTAPQELLPMIANKREDGNSGEPL